MEGKIQTTANRLLLFLLLVDEPGRGVKQAVHEPVAHNPDPELVIQLATQVPLEKWVPPEMTPELVQVSFPAMEVPMEKWVLPDMTPELVQVTRPVWEVWPDWKVLRGRDYKDPADEKSGKKTTQKLH